MTDHPDRQRVRPTLEGRTRLLAAIEATGQPHVVDPGVLGEYAELVVIQGRSEADALLPEVAAHLATGCASCADELPELVALVSEMDRPSPPQPPSPTSGRGGSTDESPAPTSASRGSTEEPLAPASGHERAGARELIDSGIHAADLPDPRAAEEEAARRQRLRRLRDWLLVAAAVSILLIGLSLIGLAYLATNQSGPARLGLTPVTETTPVPPAAPPGQPNQPGLPASAPVTTSSPGPGASGRAAPNGMLCPATHPIKGNHESMIYHRQGGAFYEQTRPEECFATPADAEAAGYRASQR